MVLSKDTLEHISDLRTTLQGITKRMKPKAILYAGVGPLYHSPHGDHATTKVRIPWGHLIIPEDALIRRLNKNRSSKIKSIRDLGINKLALADYLGLFHESGLRVLYMKVNAGSHPILKLLSAMREFRPLQEYFSYNFYAIMQKPTGEDSEISMPFDW